MGSASLLDIRQEVALVLHVAIVSFGYPPIPHVSGTRAARMARGLAEIGWAASVVTVDWRPHDTPTLDGSSDGLVRVVRVDPRPWYASFDPSHPPFKTEPTIPNGALRRFDTFRRTLAWGPFARWAQQALRELLAIHNKAPIDVVWAIRGDDSCHEIACRFSHATGVPWVADFKDPWNVFHSGLLVPVQWVATWLRLRSASALTETCEAQGKSDARFGRPWQLVWSGYDSAMMRDAKPLRTSGQFTVAYFGSFGHVHDVSKLARICGSWMRTLEPSGEKQALHVFSTRSNILDSAFLHERLDVVRYHDRVCHQNEAFARSEGGGRLDAPMTHLGRSHVLVGVKELEYFASGTPVLCIGALLPELRRVLGPAPQLMEAHDEESAVVFQSEESSHVF